MFGSVVSYFVYFVVIGIASNLVISQHKRDVPM